MDVGGNRQSWLKVRDLTKGVTYCFRVQAKTISFGPELGANITAGPAEGEGHRVNAWGRTVALCLSTHTCPSSCHVRMQWQGIMGEERSMVESSQKRPVEVIL